MLDGMDNMHLPPEGGSPDAWPTQQFGPVSAGQGPGPAGPQPTAASRGRRLRHWGLGLTAAAVLVLGGGAAGAALAGGSPSGTGQTTAMSTLLSAASAPSSAIPGAARARCRAIIARQWREGHPLAALRARRACLRGRRLRLLGGIHGQVTFETEKGPRTVAFERGAIESVASGSVVVKAPDGTTWTWVLVSSTVVRHDHQLAGTSALASGERVFVGGPMSGSAHDARLIVIRPAAAGGSGSGSGASPSAGTSAS